MSEKEIHLPDDYDYHEMFQGPWVDDMKTVANIFGEPTLTMVRSLYARFTLELPHIPLPGSPERYPVRLLKHIARKIGQDHDNGQER